MSRLTNPLAPVVDELLSKAPMPCKASLDVGCGAGGMARRLSRASELVVAIDRAAHMIETARSLSAEYTNIEYRHEDFLTSDLPTDYFDFVVSFASVHHMDFDRALEKMGAVTRPGGVVVIFGLARDRTLRDYASSAIGFAQGFWRATPTDSVRVALQTDAM